MNTCDLTGKWKNSDVGYTCECLTGYTDDVNVIRVTMLTNVLLMCHQVSSIQPVPTKGEVTSVHVRQVSKALIMLVMVLMGDKTNHITQIILAKSLSNHLNVLVKMDVLVMDSTV